MRRVAINIPLEENLKIIQSHLDNQCSIDYYYEDVEHLLGLVKFFYRAFEDNQKSIDRLLKEKFI